MNDAVSQFKKQGAYVVTDGPCSEDDLRSFVAFARLARIQKFDAKALWMWLKDEKKIKGGVMQVAFYLRRLNTSGKLEGIGIRITDEHMGSKRVYAIIPN